MSQQIQITGGAKVRNLEGVLTGTSGVISSVPLGAANGVATLGGDGKVPSSQLPSYVDDVVEVANYAALPAIGETGKIYITLDNNKVYRWTGSTYVEITSNNAVWGAITGTLSNQTDLQNALNAKQNTITLTTTGTSGASTLVGSTLNIPNYSTDLSGYVPYTGATANVNLGTFDLTTDIVNLNQLKAIGSGGINIYSNSGTHIALMGGGGGAGTTLYGGLIGTSASFSSSITATNAIFSGEIYNTITGAFFMSNAIANVNYPTYGFYNDQGLGMYRPTADTLGFVTNDTERIRLTSGGNVLIGTTFDNGYALQINGSASFAYGFTSVFRGSSGANDILVGNTGSTFYVGGPTLILGTLSATNFSGTSSGTNTGDQTLAGLGGQPQLNGTGFVKATGTTISYDNTSYLALTGGTLTGPLSGTSATLSSFVKTGAGLNITGYTNSSGANNWELGTDASGYYINAINRTSGIYNQPAYFDAQKIIFNSGSGGNVSIGTIDAGYKLDVNGTGRFSGALTGTSATFSGLVTNYNVFNTQTASYTLVLADASKIIEMNVGSANTVTVPTNASVAFPIGTEITVMQLGAGVTTLVAASGVTFRSKDFGTRIGDQYTGATLIKRGTNEWYIIGNIQP